MVADESTGKLDDGYLSLGKLFESGDVWGWEYIEPTPPHIAPFGYARPVFQDQHPPPRMTPGPVSESSVSGQFGDAIGVGVATFIAGLFVVGTFLETSRLNGTVFGGLLGIVLLVALIVAVQILWFRRERRERIRRSEEAARKTGMLTEWRVQQIRAHEEEDRRWLADSRAHDEQNQLLVAEFEKAPAWFPVVPRSDPAQIDVFGGVPAGWSCLIATTGMAQLGRGSRVLVVDFSNNDVARGLTELALQEGFRVTASELPRAGSVNLLAGLDDRELSEVIAEALSSLRKSPTDDANVRRLDARLCLAVAERLDGNPSFARLAAGTRVLARAARPDDETILTPDEYRAINAHVDMLGTGERVTDQVRYLADQFDLLAGNDEETEGAPAFWPDHGVGVITTASNLESRKDALDRVLYHRLLHELRSEQSVRGNDMLIVAGADHMGLKSLESLSRHARRAGVRLVLMLEHLREDTGKLVGSAGSATILMQMGNPAEARIAADYIGRGHHFTLSQITRQAGQTLTDGLTRTLGGSKSSSYSIARTSGTTLTDSDTTTVGGSRSTNRQRGDVVGGMAGFIGGPAGGHGSGRGSVSSGSNWSRSRGRSVASSESTTATEGTTSGTSWSDAVNKSIATQYTDGTTIGRSYDYRVEPNVVQALSATAFLLVEANQAGRRFIAGDCNPALAGLERTATHPHEIDGPDAGDV